jgi:hypothetical protein
MTNMHYGAGMARQPDDPGRRSRTGARSFAQQLEDAVRENPVPAALIGVGCLWMFMGGSRTSLFGNGRERSVFSPMIRSTGEAAYEAAQRGGSALTRAAGGATETLSDLGTRAAEMTRTAAAAVGDAVSGLNPPAVEAASSAPENTGSAVAHAVKAAPTWAGRASQTAQHAGAEWSRSAQQSMAELFERQPLVLGAVGLAIGAGIAASLPTTETETRFMGEASETLREKAYDLASDKAHEVKSMAGRALQEAEAQGLTPRAAGDALRGLTDKVVGVAEAAGRSVSEQLHSEKSGSDSDQVFRPSRTPTAQQPR